MIRTVQKPSGRLGGPLEQLELSYSIHPRENLLRVRIAGEITVDGIIKFMNQIGADSSYRRDMRVLVDFRESTSFGQWDYSETQRYRDYLVRIGAANKSRWAAVVKPGPVAAIWHVVIVISEAITSKTNMRMFEDPQLALRWVSGEID
jgi:hypothetical protein